MKVFLSHSSRDKTHFVEPLARKIGPDRVIYDAWSFEIGLQNLNEIYTNLEESDMFVILLSNSAIESEWVQKELFKAKELLDDSEKMKKIFPIIIDPSLKYTDERFPKWLIDYNLKVVTSVNKVAELIKKQLLLLSFETHPRLKEKEEIFVGRNDIIEKFEERIDDFMKDYPVALIASGIGLQGIGRKKVIKEALIKKGAVKRNYSFPIIKLSAFHSIEDLILNINSLGIIEEVDEKNFMSMSPEDKLDTLNKQLEELKNYKERIIIDDDGCIVRPDGTIVSWFFDIINKIKSMKYIVFGIASRHKPLEHLIVKDQSIFFCHIQALNKSERGRLLYRYLEFEGLNVPRDDMEYLVDLLSGFPEQAYYTVSLLKEAGLPYVKRNTNLIVEYNTERVSSLVNTYESNQLAMNILSLLTKYQTIGYSNFYSIVGEEPEVGKVMDEFFIKGICESYGTLKEYIRLNDVIYDYLIRTSLTLPKEYTEKISDNLKDFLKNHDKDEYISDFHSRQLLIKEAIIKKEIDSIVDLLVPSHFLFSMKELYDVHKKFNDVIELAKKVLENESNLDGFIANEIRYYLCMALARNKDPEFKKEVMKVTGAEHHFLFGFYYRQIGKTDKAIESYKTALDKRPIFSRAQRDLVQAYLSIEDYESAHKLAKENYENDKKNNPFHIHAYFTCLLRTNEIEDNSKVLQNLLKELEMNKHEHAQSFFYRCKAQYLALIENNEKQAMEIIDEAIDKAKTNLSSEIRFLVDKFYICAKFQNIPGMESVLKQYKIKADTSQINNYNSVLKFEIMIHAQKNEISHIPSLIEKLKSYPEDLKAKLKLKYCG